MEMRAELGKLCQLLCKFSGNDPWLQRSQTDALQPLDGVNFLYQRQQLPVVPVAMAHRIFLHALNAVGT